MDRINPKSICMRWPSESINKFPVDIDSCDIYVDSDDNDDDDGYVDDSITIMSIFYEQ